METPEADWSELAIVRLDIDAPPNIRAKLRLALDRTGKADGGFAWLP
ncbi:MAG: hypothetical protein ACLP9L_39095 [Thermoguttaceae bacterium]